MHLGKSSFSNIAQSGKALCIPPTWNPLFSPHPGNTVIEDYVTLPWILLSVGNLTPPLVFDDLTAKPRAEPVHICCGELSIPDKHEFVAKHYGVISGKQKDRAELEE